MTQFLNDKDGALGKEFWGIHKDIFQNRRAALETFKDNPTKIKRFLEVAQGYSDIGGYLTSEQWLQVADYIFTNANRIGTLNFYVDIFKLIFGESAEVAFNVATPSPGVLEITITYIGGGLFPRITSAQEARVVDTGDERVASIINNIIAIENINGVLSKIRPQGIFTKITIRATSGDQE